MWCLIASGALKTPREERGRSTARTLEGILRDYIDFLGSGGDLKDAKNHNNVMGSHFFDIELDQVCTNNKILAAFKVYPFNNHRYVSLASTLPWGYFFVFLHCWRMNATS